MVNPDRRSKVDSPVNREASLVSADRTSRAANNSSPRNRVTGRTTIKKTRTATVNVALRNLLLKPCLLKSLL